MAWTITRPSNFGAAVDGLTRTPLEKARMARVRPKVSLGILDRKPKETTVQYHRMKHKTPVRNRVQ
jgi:hypothetical protein